MNKELNVLGLAGSLRRDSINAVLLRAAQQLAPAELTIQIAELADIPLYNADLEAAALLPSVVRLRQQIRDADALLIATPEYNGSLPGVLKNALDWASRPYNASCLHDKPLAVMGVGGRYGTMRAQLHLRQIAVTCGMLPLSGPELAITETDATFDELGQLVDERSRRQLQALLSALAQWTLRLQPATRQVHVLS